MTIENLVTALSIWQTLIGAILALIAALWTIHETRKEAKAQGKRHNDALLRKKFAARAQMPDALSEMSMYVRASCAFLVSGETKPAAPIVAMSTLKGVIEHIDTDEAAKTYDLVSWYQVQNARLMNSKKIKPFDRAEMLYDAALLQAKVNRLFDYARNEEIEILPDKPDRQEMIGSLKNAVTVEVWATRYDDFAMVIDFINKRHEPKS
jgi:hypothetical protein